MGSDSIDLQRRRAFTERQQGEVVELNVQVDHVHLLVIVPPKVSVSDVVGTVILAQHARRRWR